MCVCVLTVSAHVCALGYKSIKGTMRGEQESQWKCRQGELWGARDRKAEGTDWRKEEWGSQGKETAAGNKCKQGTMEHANTKMSS